MASVACWPGGIFVSNKRMKKACHWAPLWVATFQGKTEDVKRLIENGAPIEQSGDLEGGTSPLMCAVFRGRILTTRMLLKKGADVSAKRRDGCTPLHIAAMAGHEQIALILIKHGASVSAVTQAGKTPLQYCQRAPTKLLKKRLMLLLRAHGAAPPPVFLVFNLPPLCLSGSGLSSELAGNGSLWAGRARARCGVPVQLSVSRARIDGLLPPDARSFACSIWPGSCDSD